MTAAEFLRTVWPDTGLYALARPFLIPGTTKWTYIHRTFDSIDAAARFVEQTKHLHDTFFAVHTLKESRVWNSSKPDWKTGELGAYEVRTQANMAMARAFFFDLDVGVSTPRTQKYATQAEALHDLIRFCREARLPKPMVTSSGGGLHVYWLLTDAIPSPLWRDTATQLRQLAVHHGLKADPARTTDTASVLRVAGTFNRKTPDTPRLVRTLTRGATTPTERFLGLVADALTRVDLTPKLAPVFLGEQEPSLLGSNLEEVYDGPPVTMKALVSACAQVQQLVRARGNVSEPEWYHGINLVRFVERGTYFAHKISEGHPNYDADETDAKLVQLESKGIKPTSCLKLAEVAGDAACVGCIFAGKVKSPIVAARFKDLAPAPVVTQVLGVTITTTTVPPPPAPYTRLKAGGVAFEGKDKEGDTAITVIYPHDLFPLRRLVNTASSIEQQMWRVTLPREGDKDFILDSDALYDRRKFVTTIANHGIYPNTAQLPYLQEYMIAYISELQKLTDAEEQNNHLGWADDHTRFILPDRVLQSDGTARPAMLSIGAQRSSAQVHKKGDLATQVELLKFYNRPAYIQNQFFIMASLAAPIFYATGHHGVILNASGEAGSSKSTSLYTAASFWGQPELYPINGTNNGATVRGRNERVSTLANLPVCVDEITHMAVRDAVDLAMSITQPGHRIRLDTSGVERSGAGSYKATMMLATANNSLHGLLSTDNAAGTAGSMRVVEIMFAPNLIHKKHEADVYWHQLKQHYGHIGEAFMVHVLQHEAQVSARVREVMQEVDIAANIKSSERFWSATIAAVVVAAEIAQSLGLTVFDPAALRQWALEVQVPYMRGVVTEEYSSPLGLLAEYLETINGDMLIASKMASNANLTNVIKAPRSALLAHYDPEEKIMWVLKKGFKDYCIRTGANYLKILDELTAAKLDASGKQIRVVNAKHTRKVLGAGTEYAKAQSWCFAINMSHPDVTGVVDLAVSSSVPATKPLRKIS
jgi:hypothetical protein